VKSGDTLGKIATAHKTSVKEIQKVNNLATTQIKAGQKLKMPLASAAPASAAGTIIPVGTTSPPALVQ
jgi:membrane-bound lytic murein transglycosylase D